MSENDSNTPPTISTKYCPRCGLTKPKADFNRRSARPSGLQSHCKACRSAHYFANKSHVNAVNTAYYQTHKEQAAERQRRLLTGNVEKHAIRNNRRQALSRGASGNFTENDIADLRLSQTDKRGRLRCWWCNKAISKFEIDHRIPLARGGSNFANNLCLSCPTCNKSKGKKLPHEWNGRLL